MLEKLRNIFQVPELKRRILFTLALFVVYRLGEHVPTPGVNARALAGAFAASGAAGGLFGLYDLFVGGAFSRATIFALGHHAVHLRLDHPAAARRGGPVLREAAQGGRGGPEEDHPVHALRHGADLDHPVLRLQRVPGEPGRLAGPADRARARASCSPSRPSSRRPPAPSSSCGWARRSPSTASATASRSSSSSTSSGGVPNAILAAFESFRGGIADAGPLILGIAGDDGGGDRGGHPHDPGGAQDPGAVRQAHRRPADVRRGEHAHPAARQHRRRDPDHLRVERHDPAGHGRGLRPAGPARWRRWGSWFNPHELALQHPLRGSSSSSSPTSTPRSC